MLAEVDHLAGFLVVRRVDWFRDLPIENPASRPADREPAVRLTNEQVQSMYRGVDGVLWPEVAGVNRPPLVNGLAPSGEYGTAFSYFFAASKLWKCDLLFLRLGPEQNPAVLPAPGFDFLGYDLGHYESEWSVYSCVLHEVIYGLNQKMRAHASSLNDSLLIPDAVAVKSLRETRDALLREGADLEAGLEMRPIAIHGRDKQADARVTNVKGGT